MNLFTIKLHTQNRIPKELFPYGYTSDLDSSCFEHFNFMLKAVFPMTSMRKETTIAQAVADINSTQGDDEALLDHVDLVGRDGLSK